VGNNKILGRWKGLVKQELHDQLVTLPMTINLVPNGDKITGRAILDISSVQTVNVEVKKFEIELKGKFLQEDIVQLEYNNPNDSISQFGSMILKINENKLTGKFLGYGPESRDIIYGRLEFSRK